KAVAPLYQVARIVLCTVDSWFSRLAAIWRAWLCGGGVMQMLETTLNKRIPIMVRQAHHQRIRQQSVRPRTRCEAGSEAVEGLVQRCLKPTCSVTHSKAAGFSRVGRGYPGTIPDPPAPVRNIPWFIRRPRYSR